MAYLTNKMQTEDTNSINTIISWLAENWVKIGIFGLVSQFINKFFAWLTKRSEARIKEIYLEQYEAKVEPEMTKLRKSMDELKESIWQLKDKIK